MLKIISVVGARPNFMKIAPIIEEIKKHRDIENILVHTGQHYDKVMSKLFFEDLDISKPDINLGVGSSSHAEQTAKIMTRFEKVLKEHKPDLVLVVGDVNSTLACSVTAAKLNIVVGHVEAGLRSFDRTMPEEINRIVTDSLSSILFTTCKDANMNLIREGISKENIFFVGNVMIDSLLKNIKRTKSSDVMRKLGLKKKDFMLVTLHRPVNVDKKENLKNIICAFSELAKTIKIVFPIHPRAKERLEKFGFLEGIRKDKNIILAEPLGYLDFLSLMLSCKLVLTDSGGIQEETSYLDIPCLTLRENTERPITISQGTNKLVKINPDEIIKEVKRVLSGKTKKAKKIQLWDGKTAERITKVLTNVNGRFKI